MSERAELLAPRARDSGLVVRKIENEVLVYDRERDEAHVLNDAAALVWKHCDGRTTVSEIARFLRDELHITANEQTVWHSLLDLAKYDLLEEQVSRVPPGVISRRQMVVAGAVAAVITSLAVPAGAAAASVTCQAQRGGTCSAAFPCCASTGQTCCESECSDKLPNGQFCNGNGNCCSGICTGNPRQCASCVAAGFGPCNSRHDCCPGLFCSHGHCATCVDTGGDCTAGSDCCSGLCKSNGKCENCNAVGQICKKNKDCCSGVCTNGTCLCTPGGSRPGPKSNLICKSSDMDLCCSKTCAGNGTCANGTAG